MMLRRSLITLSQTIIIVCLVNGLFLYLYFNDHKTNDVQSTSFHSIVRSPSSLSFQGSISLGQNATLSLRQKQLQIIYYKTHKTASTTVGSILFRLGAQHGLRFLPFPDHYYNFGNVPTYEVNITLLHHKPVGFQEMMKHYKRLVPDGKFLSVLREPTRRYLSHYHYYLQPADGRDFDTYLGQPEFYNQMVFDFGIYNESSLELFMETSYNQFIFLMTEKLDESLLLLKKAWGWSLQDILYLNLNDACARGTNFAGYRMSCRPLYGNLTAEQLQKMRKNNKLDVALYERALNDTNAVLAQQPQSFWEELAVFKQMQLDLQELCTPAENKTIPATCEPYFWDDTIYEVKLRDGHGYAPKYPIFSVEYGSF